MRIYNIQINHLKNPIGIAGENIRVHWKVDECVSQSAFHVQVLDIGENVLEDSGKLPLNQTFYKLKNMLPSKGKYRVLIKCFDENDTPSEVLESTVITGIDQTEWKAKWINPELGTHTDIRQRGAYLIQDFIVSKEQLDTAQRMGAYLYATCHGIMNIYMNGKEITDHQLMPGTQQYNKRLMVETFSVKKFLDVGVNTIMVTLGDGWYRGAMGNNQATNIYGSDIALLAQLEIDREVILKTDENWKATSEGPLGLNDFMQGEEYDATRTLNNLHQIHIEEFGYRNLIPVDTVPIVPHERFKPKLIEVPNGEKVLDFGQNLVGYVELEFEGKAGKRVILTCGETLDKDGNFTISNFQNERKATTFQRIIYTCKSGVNHYHPTKTYMGFRYVKVEADFSVQPEWFTGVAIYSDMEVTTTFSCDLPEVNQLFQNALWSMKGNFIDVPTDCPTREKSGYSGDCQAYVNTAMYLMDCYSVYAKWIREMSAGQYEDGCVPQIAPKDCPPEQKEFLFGKIFKDGGIGWSDAFEIVPYRIHKRYGDDSIILENYDALKKWTDYEINRAKKTRLSNLRKLPRQYRKYMLDKGWMWGEWLEPNQDDVGYMKKLIMNGDPEVGTAFFFQHLKCMEEMAGVLGKTADTKEYHSLAEKVKEAYRAVYTKQGMVTEESRQCRYVRPIAHNLLTEEEKKQNASRLAELIHENGNHLNTGFLTTHELCRVLTDYDQVSTAYDLLLQEDMPGFLYSVKKGCTTIPESWNCFKEDGEPYNSFNHYSYGAVVGWLIDSVCGIRVNDGKIVIAPKPDKRLGSASTVYESPYGRIESSWKCEGDSILYRVVVPANNHAFVKIGGREEIEVTSGIYKYSCSF